jgi:hypothetical protein
LPITMPPTRPAAAAPPARIGVLALRAAEPIVSVTALTAPLGPLPLDDVDRVLREALDRFELAAVRLRWRDLAAGEDRFVDPEPDDDDRLAVPALLPAPAPRLLAGVERPLDERACEATVGPSFAWMCRRLYPTAALTRTGWASCYVAGERRVFGSGATGRASAQ